MAGNPAEPELAARPAALAVPLAALTRRRSPRCLPRRASASSRWPDTLHSPGGDGDRAEGRTPFAALSAGARGGLKARSAFRQCTPRANLELLPGTSGRLAP